MGSIWMKSVPGGGHTFVTSCEPIRLVNACLRFSQPPAEGRSVLLFGEDEGCLAAISAFKRGSFEHDRLQVELEVGRTYIFSVIGPFSIDIVGYTLPMQFLFQCPGGGAYRSWACLSASYLSRSSSSRLHKEKGVRKKRTVLSPLEPAHLEGRRNGDVGDTNDLGIAASHTERTPSLTKARALVLRLESTTATAKGAEDLTEVVVGEPARLHSRDGSKEAIIEPKMNPKGAKSMKGAISTTGSKNATRKKGAKEVPTKEPEPETKSAKTVKDATTATKPRFVARKAGTKGVAVKGSALQSSGDVVEELVGEAKAKVKAAKTVQDTTTPASSGAATRGMRAKKGAVEKPAVKAEEKGAMTTEDTPVMPRTRKTTRKVRAGEAAIEETTLQTSEHVVEEVFAGSQTKAEAKVKGANAAKDSTAPGIPRVVTRWTSVREVRVAVEEPEAKVKGKGAKTAKNAPTMPRTRNTTRQVGAKEDITVQTSGEVVGCLVDETQAECSKTAKDSTIFASSRATTRGMNAKEVAVEKPLQQQLGNVGKQTTAKAKMVNAMNYTLTTTDSGLAGSLRAGGRRAAPTTRMTRRMAAAANEGTGGCTSDRVPSAIVGLESAPSPSHAERTTLSSEPSSDGQVSNDPSALSSIDSPSACSHPPRLSQTPASEIARVGRAPESEADADVIGSRGVVETNIRWKINLAKGTINIVKGPAEQPI